MRWLGNITNSTEMNLSKFHKLEKDRGACVLQSCGHRVRHDLATEQ